MKVGILGAGAMGSFIGAHLVKGGADVTLVDPFAAHMDAIAENGLSVTIGEETEIVNVAAVKTPDEAGPQDVIIVLVKGPFTRSALQGAGAMFTDDTIVLSFQNGVGNVPIIKEFVPGERAGYGTLALTAMLLEPGKISGTKGLGANIHFTNETKTFEGNWKELAEALTAGGFEAEFTDDTDVMIWTKLMVNCCSNLLCGLIRIKAGPAFYLPEGYDIQRHIAEELAAVANAIGIPLKLEEAWDAFENGLMPKAKEHYPSSAQDVINKKPSEIDFLNGAVWKYGQEAGVPTPYNEVVTKLVHLLEATYDIQFGSNK
ncbi:MAG: 2-dehydropantoate 2-reductase [Clostridiales Family XIII bacterium]|nr:2-dehydropantoate 2-reductase [Clostridiales Family XIII bacterium]